MTRPLFLVFALFTPGLAVAGEVCKAPNVPRVVVAPVSWFDSSPIACPEEGLCWQKVGVSDYMNLKIHCFTPEEHAAAIERGKNP